MWSKDSGVPLFFYFVCVVYGKGICIVQGAFDVMLDASLCVNSIENPYVSSQSTDII